jgi:hypothetical protein
MELPRGHRTRDDSQDAEPESAAAGPPAASTPPPRTAPRCAVGTTEPAGSASPAAPPPSPAGSPPAQVAPLPDPAEVNDRAAAAVRQYLADNPRPGNGAYRMPPPW